MQKENLKDEIKKEFVKIIANQLSMEGRFADLKTELLEELLPDKGIDITSEVENQTEQFVHTGNEGEIVIETVVEQPVASLVEPELTEREKSYKKIFGFLPNKSFLEDKLKNSQANKFNRDGRNMKKTIDEIKNGRDKELIKAVDTAANSLVDNFETHVKESKKEEPFLEESLKLDNTVKDNDFIQAYTIDLNMEKLDNTVKDNVDASPLVITGLNDLIKSYNDSINDKSKKDIKNILSPVEYIPKVSLSPKNPDIDKKGDFIPIKDVSKEEIFKNRALEIIKEEDTVIKTDISNNGGNFYKTIKIQKIDNSSDLAIKKDLEDVLEERYGYARSRMAITLNKNFELNLSYVYNEFRNSYFIDVFDVNMYNRRMKDGNLGLQLAVDIISFINEMENTKPSKDIDIKKVKIKNKKKKPVAKKDVIIKKRSKVVAKKPVVKNKKTTGRKLVKK